MKIKEHPLRRYGLVKDFEFSRITFFDELTEEQKEFEIIGTTYKTIMGEKNRVYIIASPDMMKEWNLKPMKYRFSQMEIIAGEKGEI